MLRQLAHPFNTRRLISWVRLASLDIDLASHDLVD